MTNMTRFAVALGLAGAALAHSSSSFAQDYLRPAYAPLPVGDCYYNIAPDCRGEVPVVVSGPYAYANGLYGSYNAITRPYGRRAYRAPTVWISPGLTGGDWTAVHGANDD